MNWNFGKKIFPISAFNLGPLQYNRQTFIYVHFNIIFIYKPFIINITPAMLMNNSMNKQNNVYNKQISWHNKITLHSIYTLII